jgi:2-oxoglutarate dehydrogenase E1 component
MKPETCRQIQDCNMQVVYPSTPANYFHVLRRQVHREFRKPLIVMNSKNLMRHPLARSKIEEFARNTKFTRMYGEAHKADLFSKEKIKRIVYCSGQVYYALLKARELNGVKDVAIARVEQISPFPFDLVQQEADNYPKADVVWCQEEPMNMGCWTYVHPRLNTALAHSTHHKNKTASVVSRDPTAAVATGNKIQHIQEEHKIISEALFGKAIKSKKVVNGVPQF